MLTASEFAQRQPDQREPYYRRRIAEIAALPPPEFSQLKSLNTRFHYARLKHRGPFDLYWNPRRERVCLRVCAGRRVLPVPRGAQHIGRYDRASVWEQVKADFLAVMGGRE